MLADFTVTIHDVDRPMSVRIKVHDNLAALRSATTQHDRRWSSRKKRVRDKYKDTLGICQRFHMQNSDVYAVVRLAPPHIGAAMVTHELTHAAVWLWEIKHQFKDVPLTCENDEWFAWILGELVRRTVDQLYDNGVYG